MLKVLPNNAFSNTANVKCGEIYCQSSTQFTILCSFCQMKSFEFCDYLLHIKNIHFENDLLKTEEVNVECTPYFEVNVKNEFSLDDDNNSSSSCDSFRGLINAQTKEDTSKLIKWQTNSTNENKSYESSSEQDDNDNDFHDDAEDDEYKPPKSLKHSDSRNHQCESCGKAYKNIASLKLHIKKEHDEHTPKQQTTPKSLKCEECNEEFNAQSRLDQHCINKHSGIKCSGCDKRFGSRCTMKRHEVVHLGVKNFVCEFENCEKRFFSRRHLTIHKRTHTGPKNFICDVCGYSCRVRETLRVHYRVHTGEKPYSCQLCNKRFASSSLLCEHKATHSSERPHVCDVCGATFSRPKSLYHHKHLHLGGKKFKCKVCGNAYAQAAGLAGHMRKHKEGLY